MKRTWYKIMFQLIQNTITGLWTSIANAFNHTKCILLSNQKCMIQTTLINLHPSEPSQKFHCDSFAVKLDWCVRRFNTLKAKPS